MRSRAGCNPPRPTCSAAGRPETCRRVSTAAAPQRLALDLSLQARTLRELMARKDPQTPDWPNARKRYDGSRGWRIDARPFGWIYGLGGVRLSRSLALGLRDVIRTRIMGGLSREDAVMPYLAAGARRRQVLAEYGRWLRLKRAQVEAGERSPRTVREYERFAREGGELSWWAGRSIGEVDYASLEDWSLWLAERGLAPKTRRNVIGAFRVFLGWLRKRGALAAVPDVPMPAAVDHEPVVISPRTQAAILAAIPEGERGAYLVAAYMGLRPGEIRALAPSDLERDEDGAWLNVARACKGPGVDSPIGPTKTGKSRRLPVPEPVRAWLEAYVQPAERLRGNILFRNPRTGRRWSHWALREGWLRACREARVTVGFYEGTKHSFATAAIARDVPERSLQEYLGHADARSTRRYARLGSRALVEVIRPKRPRS